MDFYSYQSFEEPRTASRRDTPIKSIQSWKNRHGNVKSEIITSLKNASEGRDNGFNKALDKTMGYAPQQIQSSSPHKKEAFQFGDVIDVVNPLQHIPLVGTAYRSLTGDKLHPISNIIGGALYGGPIGAVTGTINAISQVQTGKDIGEHALDLFNPNDTKQEITHKKITMAKQTISSIQTAAYQDDVTSLNLAAMPPKRLY